jgi:uncharacterized protein
MLDYENYLDFFMIEYENYLDFFMIIHYIFNMFIERDIINEIHRWMWKEKILIITGSRQVGKTTILKYLQKHYENDVKTLYFSIDLEIGNTLFKEPKLFINLLENEIKGNRKVLVFLDEFQYIQDSGLFLKVCFDNLKKNVQFIVSGSSSLEISKTKEFLTGRKIEFRVNPLSFREYIRYKSKFNYDTILNLNNFLKLQDFNQSYKEDISIHIINYLNWGGYPEINIVKDEDRTAILKEIVGTYLQKDIAGFLNISNLEGYNNLIRILSSQIGGLINVHELSNTLRMNIETINKYLSILEGTYIFYTVSPYFTNVRKELSKMRKVYISDFGLRKIILGNPSLSVLDNVTGQEIENFIFTTLQNNSDIFRINYYRTISKSEIDFIVVLEGEIIPVEVKFKPNFSKIPVAIKNFKDNYPEKIKRSIIITKDHLAMEKETLFLPFYLVPFIRF